jgi:hypothetical protein
MHVDDVRLKRSQRSSKPHCTWNIRSASVPVHRHYLNSGAAQHVAYWAIVPQKDHGKSVTTGIQKLCKVQNSQCDSARRLLTGSKNVDYVDAAQDRTAVLIL